MNIFLLNFANNIKKTPGKHYWQIFSRSKSRIEMNQCIKA